MRFKSVLGAILFVLLASFIALLIFVQTKSFGKIATSVLGDISEKRFKTEVKIKNFSISLFPPGLELNKVRVDKKFSDIENFKAEFGTIGFYFRLIEVEEKKLTFGEIKIADSYIEYRSPKREEEIKEIDPQLIKKIFDARENLPLRIDNLILENSKVVLNHELVDARRVKIFKKGKDFVARFHLANIQPSENSDFSIDEVWGDAVIGLKNLQIYRLKIQHDVHSMLIKGKVQDYYKLMNCTAALNGELILHLKSLVNEIELPEEIQLKNGSGRVNFSLNYEKNDVSALADIFIEGLKTNFIYADEIRSVLTLKDKKINLDKFSLAYKGEKLTLLESVHVANISDKSYLTKPIKASLENFSLKNALRFLPKLSVLKGLLSGELIFSYKDKDLFFAPKDKFEVKDLSLIVGKKEKSSRILKINRILLSQSSFNVVNGEFQMKASLKLPRSQLGVEGFINKSKIQFNIPDSPIDLEDLGNLANLDIKGAGILGLKVAGTLDHTLITLKGFTKGFEILGFKLGETEKNITVDLGEDSVIINKMESQFGKSHLSGNGSVNWGDAEIALGISSPDANSADLEQILQPIFKDLNFLPVDLDFKAKVDVDIFGKYRLDDLKIRSKVHFNELTAYGESLKTGSFDLSLMDKVISFKNFEAEKSKGAIDGNFSFDLKARSLKLNFNWDNIELASIHLIKRLGLNLNALLSGRIVGSGPASDYSLKLETTAFNTQAPNYMFKDSFLSLNILPKRILGKATLFGEMIETDFNLALKHGMASHMNLKVSNDDIKPILVGLFGQHLDSEEFTGSLDFETSTTFQDGFSHLNLTSTIRHFAFEHQDFKANYSSSQPAFVVRDSMIERWNLSIKQPDLFVVTSGEGIFGKHVSLVAETHINSKILEIIFAPILSADGFLRNIIRLEGRGTDFKLSLSSKTSDLDLSIDQVPVPLNDLKYNLEYANQRINLQSLTTSFDNGSVSLKGDVYFDNKQPDVNLKFMFDKAEVPILNKSSVNLSGEGIILGNNFPYTVGGEITVNKAQIVNELNEFSNKSASFSQVRFLPRNQESSLGKMFSINLNVKADNPVRLTNSLMDVAFAGEVRLMGSPSRLRGEGRLTSPPGSSRIFFKNNEYQIISADINFSPKKELTNPDFDIQALTLISTYKIYPKAYGDLERFNFDLTSDPALPRNSILSLIAFGYTDEIQNSLQSKDQRSLTQVGVGSFVFDRFKISDILNKQFGLQINLGTVIEQSNTDSLLSGRSQEGASGQGSTGTGRTKSATKIELKKRLDEALTLSVSSTMGGTIGSRQSMNLNYGINRNIQVEGVFELRTNEEGEADIIYNSIGGDLKFRRTFK
jgi:translocation and assembly module TamB